MIKGILANLERQLPRQFRRVAGLNPGLAAPLKKGLQPLVLE